MKLLDRRALINIAILVLLALAMGLPTLAGGFVGGDDRELALNHVFVNHPSWTHAVKLFTILHRDLYQPIPLLSFSAEFAVAGRLGLLDQGISGGAWLFHLTNVLLHAFNTVLVWVVLRIWQGRDTSGLACGPQSDGAPDSKPALNGMRPRATTRARAPRSQDPPSGRSAVDSGWIAFIAAMIFAIHPLQVEAVAWVNGRMMLLSTCFALVSLVAIYRVMRDGRVGWSLLCIVAVLLCGLSKVRVALPLLLVLLPLARGLKPTRRVVALWLIAFVLTGVLAAVNVFATSQAGILQAAASTLHGSRIGRTLLSVAWYFVHYVWPNGLAPWYPPPKDVHLTDGAVLGSLGMVIPIVAFMVWGAWRSRTLLIGFAWFFLTIASTLPLIPSRNVLAADRYMYLPIIGLAWASAWCAVRFSRDRLRTHSVVRRRVIGGGTLVCAATALLAVCRHVTPFYDTHLSKALRIAQLFPREPHSWEQVAWAHYALEDYEEALASARKELANENQAGRSGTYVVIGMTQLALGRHDEAIESLVTAVDTDQHNPVAKYRLATALYDLGRVDEALPYFEATVAEAPKYNRGLCKLADIRRQGGDLDQAASLYERALDNNAYEVSAILGLAQLDMDRGNTESLRLAEERLIGLLEWMPENVVARTNLGVVYAATGRLERAARAYQAAVAYDPANVTANLNLASIRLASGALDEAGRIYRVFATRVESLDQAVAVHDFFVGTGEPERALRVWDSMLQRFANSPGPRSYHSWTLALLGREDSTVVDPLPHTSRLDLDALRAATDALLALRGRRYEQAMSHIRTLCEMGKEARDARHRLLGALEGLDRAQPNSPWPFCAAAALLMADEQVSAARFSLDLCSERCRESNCAGLIARLRSDFPEPDHRDGQP